MTLKTDHRRHEDRDAREGQRAPVDIRLLLAAMKQREVDERIELDRRRRASAIIDKMVKQRRDSIAQFEPAARKDLADKEKFEIGVLAAYLPQQMSRGRDRAG